MLTTTLSTVHEITFRIVVFQSSRIIGKIACWSKEPMDRKNLHFYLNWLKDQLKHSVSIILCILIYLFFKKLKIVLPLVLKYCCLISSEYYSIAV